MNEFITSIIETLKKNGFPGKRVSLPTEKMFEAADKKGFSFNKVIDQLKAEHNIDAQIGPDKIIFSQMQTTQKSPQDMMKEAQEMMSKMDPAELKRIQEMFMNMSPEEKEEILKKGKDLGLI